MRGYFGIGIFQPTKEVNIGTLLRSAYQLGAAFVFVIDGKFRKQCSDTYNTTRHIPLFKFKSWQQFKAIIYDCQPVIVEFGENSIGLMGFTHPIRAAYILGSESNGLSSEIINDVNLKIEIESVRQPSYNVAMAGTIVMYDRLIKGAK